MPDFTFDMQLQAAITVTAPTREAAEAELLRVLDCADTNFGAFKNGSPVLGETSLLPETLRLGMIDSEPYVPPEAPIGRETQRLALLERIENLEQLAENERDERDHAKIMVDVWTLKVRLNELEAAR